MLNAALWAAFASSLTTSDPLASAAIKLQAARERVTVQRLMNDRTLEVRRFRGRQVRGDSAARLFGR